MMPEMDGFMVVEQIKQHRALTGATILMLSSADRAEDNARCQELGVALYLRKPIKQSELLDAILNALSDVADTEVPAEDAQATDVEPPVPPPLAAHASLRILLAEDNEVNQALAVKLLEKRGHTVVVTGNGHEALAALDCQSFDVILMDVQMPEMDGLAATAAIREKEKATCSHLPIVALTAHALKGDRERCLEAGMDAYVAKPLRAQELCEILAQLVVRPVAVENTPCPESDAGAAVFDLATTLDRVEGNRELLQQMIDLFATQATKLLSEIRASVARKDGLALERAAHKLKGSVGNFGASEALAAAQRLECLGRSADFGPCPRACVELEREITRLERALAELTPESVA
jgi:CheY-like chemotaxis protein